MANTLLGEVFAKPRCPIVIPPQPCTGSERREFMSAVDPAQLGGGAGALEGKAVASSAYEEARALTTGDTHAMTTTAAGPSIDLLLDINAAFNARDVDRILSFFDDDATFLMARGPEPNGRRVHGKAAIGKVLADRFKVISDMRWDHIEHFVTGNRAVSVWMVTGTSADGEALNYQGCDIYEFRGDKILNKDTYWKIVEQKDRL